MISFLLTIGFISILGQVVILRELSVAFFGIELIYILAIGIWLLGTAIGVSIGRRTSIPSIRQICLLFLLFGIFLPLEVAFIRATRILFSDVPGAYLPFGYQIVAMSIGLLPVSILLGLLFQWAAKRYVTENKTLARAYAIESGGGLFGGLASTLLLKIGIQNFYIAIFCSLISVSLILFHQHRRPASRFRYLVIFVIALLLIMLWKAPVIDRRMTTWNHPHLVAVRDTPYSRVVITGLQGQAAVFENDALSFETESTASEEFVHLTALQHLNPQSALLLGGGIEGIIREINQYDLPRVDYVELNRILVDLARQHLGQDFEQYLNPDRVQIIYADPRKFLRNSDNYDLILIGMPEPSSGQTNRFYTREFFRQCSTRLNPGGVLAFRLRSAENLWTPQLIRKTVSIYRALAAVFPDIIVLPGVTNIIIASHSPLTRDPVILSERFNSKSIEAKLVSPPYIRYLYTNDRFYQIANLLQTETGPINTDAKPVCYQYTIMIWLSKFFPALAKLDFSSTTRGGDKNIFVYVCICLVPIITVLLCRRRRSWRRILLVAAAGFVGMVFEMLLLLHYQVQSGILYQDIGILLMTFMAGLTLGSALVNKLARLSAGVFTVSRRVGAGLLAGFVILNLLFALLLDSAFITGIAATSLLMIVTGFLVAGIFAYVSLDRVKEQRVVISPLYAADLVGGCFGSLVASLVLIPIIGLEGSAYSMAAVAFLALLLL